MSKKKKIGHNKYHKVFHGDWVREAEPSRDIWQSGGDVAAKPLGYREFCFLLLE